GRSYRLAQLRCKHALQGRDLRAVAVGRGKFFEQLVRVGTRRTGKFSCRDQTVEFSDVVIELWFELEHERRRLGSGIEAFQHRIVTILTNLDAVMTEWELLKLKLAFGVGYSSILTVHQNSASRRSRQDSQSDGRGDRFRFIGRLFLGSGRFLFGI